TAEWQVLFLGFACLKSLRVFLSFTPGFSPVIKERENHRNRFNGFSVSFARQVLCTQSPEGLGTKSKALKRFTCLLVAYHRAKPGVNERCAFRLWGKAYPANKSVKGEKKASTVSKHLTPNGL